MSRTTLALASLSLIALGCGSRSGEPQPEPAPSSAAPEVASSGQASDAAEGPNQDAAKDAEPRMVVELDGGGKLEVALELEADTFMVSEPIYAEVVFSGDVEVGLAWMGRNSLGRPSNYDLTLRDASGQALTQPDAGPQMGGKSWRVDLKGGATRQKLFLPNWYESIEPGSYSIEVSTTIEVLDSNDAEPRPLEVALRQPVEVVADDADALAARVEALAVIARGEDSDAARRAVEKLAAISTSQVLEVWLELAGQPDYDHHFAVIWALGEYDDPRAVAALAKAATIRAEQLPAERYSNEELRESSAASARLTAAQSLSESPHESAREALLELRDDEYDSVRLTVLHAVAKIEGEAGTELIRSFAADASEMVRGEAARYLSER